MSGGRLDDLRDRTVLITGGSSGIGRSLALAMASRGARLALIARRADALDEVVEACRPAEAHRFVCDVADPDGQRRAFDAARSALGKIEVGVLNAGIGLHRRFTEHDHDATRRVIDVNVLGALHGAECLLPEMIDAQRGWLVFIASIAGLVPVPGEAVYSASKHAVVGFADALSLEVAMHGVHVMTVCPGSVRTDFIKPDERDRVPRVARATERTPEAIADATLEGLAHGAHRVVVPRRLEVAIAARGVVPGLVRKGTARATRDVLS